MWTREFWKATAERMVRGGAAALGGALVAGDWVLDIMNVNGLKDGLTVFLGGALTSLLMALAGGAFGAGTGPSFVGEEVLDPNGPNPPPPPAGQINLPVAIIVAVVVGVVLLWLFGAFGPMPLK